ncbi:MAG: hypothetical protein KKB20_02935 [Proteobacteria bacterium]|nr:hypothetical protein [Pseudomonadota bacterium]
MKKFEYEITTHMAEEFKKVAFYCSAAGDCNLEDVPSSQIEVLAAWMNERGLAGWELVQMAFSKDGMLAVWKRETAGLN